MKVAPEHPFSNGTEGREWMATWCEWCAEDHACHDPENDFSPVCRRAILLSLRNKPVAEWTDYSEELGFTLPFMTGSKVRRVRLQPDDRVPAVTTAGPRHPPHSRRRLEFLRPAGVTSSSGAPVLFSQTGNWCTRC